VTTVPEELARWLEGVYRVSVEPSRDVLRGAVGFDVYFERGGERFKLHTDFYKLLPPLRLVRRRGRGRP